MDFESFKEVFESSKMDFILSHAVYCRDVLKTEEKDRGQWSAMEGWDFVLRQGCLQIRLVNSPWQLSSLKLVNSSTEPLFPKVIRAYAVLMIITAPLFQKEVCSFGHKCPYMKPSCLVFALRLCKVVRVWLLSGHKFLRPLIHKVFVLCGD